MLGIFRRHLKRCAHRPEGRRFRRCQCPVWVDGHLHGTEIHKSLGTRDWQKAQGIVRGWEAEGRLRSTNEPVTIKEAWQKFLADAAARKLTEASIYKYELLARRMDAFTERGGYRFLFELTVDVLSTFRTEWRDGALSSLKKLERLRTFLGFAVKRKWIPDNPAGELNAPKVQVKPTMPFTHEEMVSILAAIEHYATKTAHNGKLNAQRMRSLVLLLRYSGMRIGDAVSLSVDRVTNHRLFLYTAKTGTPVYTVLPDFVVRALEATPKMTERYYFWTGVGKLCTAVRMWDMRLKRIFDQAKLARGHAHRFRDTFAVELLLQGVPMERVAVLLGHQSIKITERHYAPWVRARQEQLEEDVSRVWSCDPLVLLEGESQTKGTPKLREKSTAVN